MGERVARAAAQGAAAVQHGDVGAEPDIVENGKPRREAELLRHQPATQFLGMLRAADRPAHAVNGIAASGARIPISSLTSVLLPAPFSPQIARISPARSDSDTSRSAHAGEALAQPFDGENIHAAALPAHLRTRHGGRTVINTCTGPATARGSPW